VSLVGVVGVVMGLLVVSLVDAGVRSVVRKIE
jgi:hypothetical protein